MNDRISWTCDECEGPVAPRTGYLAADDRAAERYIEALAAWRAQNEQNSDDRHLPTVSLARLAVMPDQPAWAVVHADCDKRWGSGYTYAIERVSSPAGLLSFLAHVLEKDWVSQGTNVPHLIRRAVEGVQR